MLLGYSVATSPCIQYIHVWSRSGNALEGYLYFCVGLFIYLDEYVLISLHPATFNRMTLSSEFLCLNKPLAWAIKAIYCLWLNNLPCKETNYKNLQNRFITFSLTAVLRRTVISHLLMVSKHFPVLMHDISCWKHYTCWVILLNYKHSKQALMPDLWP